MFEFGNKILFKGIIQGNVSTSEIVLEYYKCFIIKLEEKIEGIPEELPVMSHTSTNIQKHLLTRLREGDKVQIKGKIIQSGLKEWNTEVVWMKADHIFNETLHFGY